MLSRLKLSYYCLNRELRMDTMDLLITEEQNPRQCCYSSGKPRAALSWQYPWNFNYHPLPLPFSSYVYPCQHFVFSVFVRTVSGHIAQFGLALIVLLCPTHSLSYRYVSPHLAPCIWKSMQMEVRGLLGVVFLRSHPPCLRQGPGTWGLLVSQPNLISNCQCLPSFRMTNGSYQVLLCIWVLEIEHKASTLTVQLSS